MIDRYHLRYFLSVVDSGNFSRAAIACNVSQPTLSVGIARLEKALGQTLFDRSNRRVALTAAGARLLGYARSIEAGFAGAERAVADSGSAAMLRLGVLVTTPAHWIEEALAATAGTLRIEIVEGRDRELRERLARRRSARRHAGADRRRLCAGAACRTPAGGARAHPGGGAGRRSDDRAPPL